MVVEKKSEEVLEAILGARAEDHDALECLKHAEFHIGRRPDLAEAIVGEALEAFERAAAHLRRALTEILHERNVITSPRAAKHAKKAKRAS